MVDLYINGKKTSKDVVLNNLAPVDFVLVYIGTAY